MLRSVVLRVVASSVRVPLCRLLPVRALATAPGGLKRPNDPDNLLEWEKLTPEQKQQAAAILQGADVPTSEEMQELFAEAQSLLDEGMDEESELSSEEGEDEGEFDYYEEDASEEGVGLLSPEEAGEEGGLSVDVGPREKTEAELELAKDQDPYLPRTREEDLRRLLRVSSEFFDPTDPSYELKARGLYKWDRVPSPAGPSAPSEVQKDLFLDRLLHVRTFLSMQKRKRKLEIDRAYRDLAAAVPAITPEDVAAADKMAQEKAAKKEAEKAAADKKKGVKVAAKPATAPTLPPAEQRAAWMNEILTEHRLELERSRSHGWTWGKKERYLRVLRGLLLHQFRSFPGARLPPAAIEQMTARPPRRDLGDVLRTRRKLEKAPLYAQLEVNATTTASGKAY